jgi:hypothetical protein
VRAVRARSALVLGGSFHGPPAAIVLGCAGVNSEGLRDCLTALGARCRDLLNRRNST